MPPVYKTVFQFENANSDRGKRHNQWGLHIWTDDLSKNFGATKGESFVGQDGVTYYTAKYKDLQSGDQASRHVIDRIWKEAGGDPYKFASIYTGHGQDHEVVKAYGDAIAGNPGKGPEVMKAGTTPPPPKATDKVLIPKGYDRFGERSNENLFPTKHPTVQNEDGTVSNVRTITVEADGIHYVIPSMVEGVQLTNDEAWRVALEQGLGKYPSFDNAAAALQASRDLHDKQPPPQDNEKHIFPEEFDEEIAADDDLGPKERAALGRRNTKEKTRIRRWLKEYGDLDEYPYRASWDKELESFDPNYMEQDPSSGSIFPDSLLDQAIADSAAKNEAELTDYQKDEKSQVQTIMDAAETYQKGVDNQEIVQSNIKLLIETYPEYYADLRKMAAAGDMDVKSMVKVIRAKIKSKRDKKEQEEWDKAHPPPTLDVFDLLSDFKKPPWEEGSGWQRLIPFVSSGIEVAELTELAVAAAALENETATPRQLKILEEYVAYSRSNKTWAYNTLNLVVHLPAFAGELYFTGGFYTAGKNATLKVAKRVLAGLLTKGGYKKIRDYGKKTATGKILTKSVQAVGGATLQTLPAGVTRIAAETKRRMLPGITLTREEKLAITGPGQGAMSAFIDATKGQWIEMVSERMGGLFKELGKPAREAMSRSYLLKRWLQKNPGADPSAFRKVLDRSGYHGVLNEMFEERMSELGRATPGIGTGEDLPDYTSEEFFKQLASEMVAFSVPGAAGQIMDYKKQKKDAKAEEAAAAAADEEAPAEEPLDPEEQRVNQVKALDEINAAEEAGDTSPGVAKLARKILERDPDFDSRSSIAISNRILEVTKEYIEKNTDKTPEEFFAAEGLTVQEGEEGDYIITGYTAAWNHIDGQVNTAIKLFKGHDADTLVEEFYHDFYEYMPEKDKKAFKEYHDKSDDGRSVEEHFGQEGRDYFFSEKLHEEAGGIRALFDNARESLKKMIARIRTIRGAKIPKKIQDMYKAAGMRDISPSQRKIDKKNLNQQVRPKSKEFKSWFGDSKVVDEKGQPMVVYHGTSAKEDFDVFSPQGDGIINWFAHDPMLSEKFAGGVGVEVTEGSRIIPSYIRMDKPLDLQYLPDNITEEEREENMDGSGLLSADEEISSSFFFKIIEGLTGEKMPSKLKKELEEEYASPDFPAVDISVGEDTYHLWRMIENEDAAKPLIKHLKGLGYDGYITSEFFLGGEAQTAYGVFEPNQIKSQFNEKPTKEDPRITHQVKKKPVFFSQAEKVVDEQFPPTMKGQSVINYLQKHQVKPEEIKWLALDKLLSKERVTREKLLDHIRANKIEVVDVEKVDDYMTTPEWIEFDKRMTKKYGEKWTPGNLLQPQQGFSVLNEEEMDEYGDIKIKYQEPSYTSEVEEGGDDYRELLLILDNAAGPGTGPGTAAEEYSKFIIEMNEKYSETEGGWHDQLTEEEEQVRDKLARAKADERVEDYQSPHWEEPNILAHVRFNTRWDSAGNKVLFIEEVQSDWHQRGAERGYDQTTVNKRLVWEEGDEEGFSAGIWTTRIPGTNFIYEITEDTETSIPSKRFITNEITRSGQRRGIITRPNLAEAKDYVQNAVANATIGQLGVPDAPFKGTGWIELVMKRMLRYAAEANFDSITWTTGAQQIERWSDSLRQNLDTIQWQKSVADKRELTPEEKIISSTARNVDPDSRIAAEKAVQEMDRGKQSVIINGIKDKKSVFNQSIPLNGSTTINGVEVTLDRLLGRTMAKQIRDGSRTGVIKGSDLSIGGRFQKKVYDKVIPNILNKMAKRNNWGTSVKPIDFVRGSFISYPHRNPPGMQITGQMKKGVMKGQKQFQVRKKKKKKPDFPRTKKGQYQALPPGINSPQKFTGLITRLMNMAREGVAGKYWYERSSDIILDAVDNNQDEAQKIAGLIGLFSQGTGIKPNIRQALRYYQQSKAGQDPSEGRFPSSMVPKAKMIMNGIIPLGIKTNNFYTNLMRHIDPSMHQGITVDLWIMRAFGFKNDAPNISQYDRVSKAITRAAKRLGWEPWQVQAAIWTTIRSKWNTVEGPIKAEAIEKGHYIESATVDKKKIPGHWKNESSRIRYRNKILKAVKNLKDAQIESVDFADLIAEEVQIITMETLPGIGDYFPNIDTKKDLVELNNMHNAIVRVITDESGHDRLAQAVGLMVVGEANQPGAWLEKVSPGRQLTVISPVAKAPSPKVKPDPISEVVQEQVDQYCALWGILTHQWGVGWHKPIATTVKRDANLGQLKFHNPKTGEDVRLTPDQMSDLTVGMADAIEEKYGEAEREGIFLTSNPDGYAFINVSENIPNIEFDELVEKVVRNNIEGLNCSYDLAKAITGLTYSNKKDAIDNNGKNYKEIISSSESSAVYKGLLNNTAPQIDKIYQDYAKRNDWGKAPRTRKKIVFAVSKRQPPPKKPRSKKEESGQAIELDPETTAQLWQRRIQDKMNRLGQVMGLVEDQRPVSDEEDAYRAAELFIGKTKDRMEIFEESILGKGQLIDRLLEAGYTMDDFGEYLHARHAKERNAHVAKIREDMPDGGSGMTNAEANEILAKHKGDKVIEAFAKEFYRKVTKRALRERLDAGLIDHKTYEHLTNYYKNYVPLFTVKEVENRRDTGGKEGKGFSVPQGAEIKRTKGSQKDRINPFFSGMHEMMGVIKRSEKNKVGLKFLDIAEEFESDAWTVTKQRYRPIFNKHGEVEFMEPKFKLGENVFAVRRDGSLYLIEINDEALARGLKNLGAEKAPKYLVKINNFLRAIVTTYNPEFLITNFSRDIQTALIHLAGEHKGVARTVLKNTPKAIRGVWRDVRGKEQQYWSQQYKDLKKTGGKVGWFDQDTLEDYQAKVEKQMERVEKGTGTPVQAAKALGEYVNHANEAIESGVRLATYEALVSKGVSKEKAAQVAKNITVNFNKKGEWGTLANSLYLFFNATVQGSFRIGASLAKSKKTRAIVGGIVASSASLALVNYMIAPEEWEKKTKWEKDNYLIFMLPNGDDIRIRVPYGYNMFHVMGQASADVIHEGQKNGFKYVDYGEAGGRVLMAANDAFSPFGAGSFFQMVAPTVLDPVVQIVENKKFHGGPIRPEQPTWSKNKPDYAQYWDVNPPSWLSRSITELLSKWSGGKEYVGIIPDEKAVVKKKAKKQKWFPGTPKPAAEPDVVEKPATFKNHYTPGWIDINPTTLDHLFGFLTGGMGKFVQRSVDLGIDLYAGKETPSRQIPVIRQFYGQPDKRGITETTLIRKMVKNSQIKIYNHVEVARFKRYVFDAIKLGRLKEDDAKLVFDVNDKEMPKIIRDFLNDQRLAQGLPKHDYRKLGKKSKKKKQKWFPGQPKP